MFFAQLNGETRIAVTGSGANGVFRLRLAEDAVQNNKKIDDIEIPTGDLMSDIHADPLWRAHLIKVMTQRAIAAA